jgi:hypothetical protein
MKQYVKRIIRKSISKLVGTEDLPNLLERLKQLTETFDALNSRMLMDGVVSANQGVQQLLSHTHRRQAPGQDSLSRLLDSGFRCFSQSDEDGLLLYVFSLVGTTNKRVVEICAGDGIECNASNLIVNHGWSGLLFDGNEQNIAVGNRFYARIRDTYGRAPILVHAWITAEKVNSLVAHHQFDGEIDLLSLDLDGMDYWIWKALTCVRPRVVILEFTPRWGPYQTVTLPYKPDFRLDFEREPWCHGASLGAFVKLGRERGYRLVGTNRFGFNAIFVRNDVGQNVLAEVSPAECFKRTPTLNHWSPDWLPSRADRPEWWDVVEV